jgi:hypothetical protein
VLQRQLGVAVNISPTYQGRRAEGDAHLCRDRHQRGQRSGCVLPNRSGQLGLGADAIRKPARERLAGREQGRHAELSHTRRRGLHP